jgi:hypothetical protein
MGGTRSTNTRNLYRILVGKPRGKRVLRTRKLRWDEIKMDLIGTECEVGDFIQLVKNKKINAHRICLRKLVRKHPLGKHRKRCQHRSQETGCKDECIEVSSVAEFVFRSTESSDYAIREFVNINHYHHHLQAFRLSKSLFRLQDFL